MRAYLLNFIEIKNFSQIFLKVISPEQPLWNMHLFMAVSKSY